MYLNRSSSNTQQNALHKTCCILIGHAQFTENENEYFPIPQTQIDLSAGADGIQKMKQNCY